MPEVAIQLIVYRSSKTLPRVLACLKAQSFKDWLLYVYDNSCDAIENLKTEQMLAASQIDYRLTVAEQNIGFTAHNEMLASHYSPFVLILNDDAFLAPDYLEKLMQVMKNKSDGASASGLVLRLVDPETFDSVIKSNDQIDSAGLQYQSLARISDRFAGCVWQDKKNELKDTQDIFGVSACAALYRREAIKRVSSDDTLFDHTFFMYKEDVELAIRLKRKQFKSYLVPEARAWHVRRVKAASAGVVNRIKEEKNVKVGLRMCSYRNQWLIYFYHFSSALGLNDIFLSCFYEIGRGLLVLISSPAVFLTSWIWIWRGLISAWRRRKELENIGLAKIKML